MKTVFKIKIIVVLLLQGSFFFSHAQLVPSIREQKMVDYTGSYEQEITFGELTYFGAGDSVMTIDDAKKYFSKGNFIASQNKFLNLGIANDNYWITFLLTNKTANNTELILNLENARLNEVNIFIIKRDQQPSVFTLGDKFPFEKRKLHYNQFAVPLLLNALDTLQVYILLRHKGNSLQMPISLHTANSFYKKIENNYLVVGITSGILLLTFFFSVFLFFKSNNRLFIFYSLYALSTLLWLVSTEGFGFQYLWPQHPEWATRFGPGFSIFNLTAFIASALAFTHPYDTTKWIRKTLWGIVIVTTLWGLQAFLPYIPINNTAVMSFFLKTSFIIYGISLGLIMPYLLYVAIKKNRIALFYFFAVIITVVFSLLLIAKNSGWINLPLTSGTFISIGLVFEVILMTLGIANQFYKYKLEKEAMLIQFIEQQKSINQRILVTQERERKRISREMHDDIGAGLTQITLISESTREKDHIAKMDDIASTSRQLTASIGEIIWSLNPDNKTLGHLYAHLREQLNKQLEYSEMQYTVLLSEEGEEIILSNEQRRNFLLVTKEIVNNAVKHSKANSISVKAEIKNESLIFIIKDDGAGYDTVKLNSGNGLKNIKGRIEEIGGTLEIVSLPGKGSCFSYIIPLNTTT